MKIVKIDKSYRNGTKEHFNNKTSNGTKPVLAEVPSGINDLAYAIYERNVEKGFYEKEKNIGEMLCLIHSEVSEALEADRNRSYAMLTESQRNILMGWIESDDFIKDYKDKVKGSFEEEMADIFIRLLDMCAFKGIDIEFHVKAKMRYNLSRKRYHGKKY